MTRSGAFGAAPIRTATRSGLSATSSAAPARVHEPDGNVRDLTYDGEGNVLRVRDRLSDVAFRYHGLAVRFEYDTEGRLIGRAGGVDRGARHLRRDLHRARRTRGVSLPLAGTVRGPGNGALLQSVQILRLSRGDLHESGSSGPCSLEECTRIRRRSLHSRGSLWSRGSPQHGSRADPAGNGEPVERCCRGDRADYGSTSRSRDDAGDRSASPW